MKPVSSKSIIHSKELFTLEQLTERTRLESFFCPIEEYNEYLFNEAVRSQNDQMALTWLFCERSTGHIAAYMSLISDAIKLSVSEKELHNLDYPFKTIPAMKIAKLAVSASFQEKYKGIGSLMIEMATHIAAACNDRFFACRFITVDADIEHNESVIEFYQKNGFILNDEMNNKKRKIISMRKDIMIQG
jgi:ribosomal protein S18 acetylase RimI-like enzyme